MNVRNLVTGSTFKKQPPPSCPKTGNKTAMLGGLKIKILFKMKVKINKLIGKLEIHYHGEERVNASDLKKKIKDIFLNVMKESNLQKEECDRKIVIEQDFLTQKEGAIRKIETIRTRVIENGVLVLDKETIPEDYKYSELKDAIDYIVKGQIVKRKFNGEDFPSLHS